jgi:ribosomal protein S18 acetylase RimI-like enzyme
VIAEPSGEALFVRAATSAELERLRAIVRKELFGSSYREAAEYFVGIALQGKEQECRGIVAERSAKVVAYALLGEVAGTSGTARLLLITVIPSARHEGIGTALCETATAVLEINGARSVIAELPNDESTAAGRAVLSRCGFTEAARIPDYYRDGVDLLVLQRARSSTSES